MTKLSELFDIGDLEIALQDGYVREQLHPTEPYNIFNYTEKAAYESHWTPVTLACRGLIAHRGTHEIVARPFAKFFNHGQAGAAAIPLHAPVHVTDKLDGSLGILYPLTDGGYAVATRGSFTSDQALHATALLHARYASYEPPAGVTVLFEILYPANRIVVDYGDTDELCLIGAVDNLTGVVLDRTWTANWRGPAAQVFVADTFAEALALPPRPNAEGVVVRCLRTGGMVKLKQADYVALHRIVTGLTARTVWQHLVDGKTLAELIAPLPDEFHDWVRNAAFSILARVEGEETRLHQAFRALYNAMPDDWAPASREGRRDFAAKAAGSPDSWAMFALLDGRDIFARLLANAKPDAGLTPSGRTHTEDTA